MEKSNNTIENQTTIAIQLVARVVNVCFLFSRSIQHPFFWFKQNIFTDITSHGEKASVSSGRK